MQDTLASKCEEYDTKLAECGFIYETLKKKSKSREEELLSLLKDQKDNVSYNSGAFFFFYTEIYTLTKYY